MMTQENAIIDQTQTYPISTISSEVDILQDTKDNVIYLTRKIQEYEKQIHGMKEEMWKLKVEVSKHKLENNTLEAF